MKKSFLCEGKMPFVTEMVHGPSAKKPNVKYGTPLRKAQRPSVCNCILSEKKSEPGK